MASQQTPETTPLLRLLLIEDTEADVALVRRLLASIEAPRMRYTLSVHPCFEDGMAALRAEQDGTHAFDAVLLDLHLPDVDGLQGLSRLIGHAPDLPVVVLTGLGSEETGEQALRIGAQDYLLKRELTGPMLVRSIRYAIERQRVEARLRISEERYALAVAGAMGGIWDLDVASGQLYLSDRGRKLLGLSAGGVVGIDALAQAFEPACAMRFRDALATHLAGDSESLALELRPRGSGVTWVALHGLAVFQRQPDGGYLATRVAGSITDISARRAAELKLRHDALHDALTGLPNRALLQDRLEVALKRLKREPSGCFAVLFFDLDRFKTVNDSLGHTVGDQLLIAVAQRLRSVVRPADTVARLGGDEFALLVDELHHHEEAIHIADRLWELIAAPMEVDGHRLHTTASIGIALSGTNYEEADEILRDADLAMYRAKGNADLRYALFDQAMHDRMVHQHTLEIDLWRALERQEFRLAYQPIVSLVSGRTVGFEALLRWQHPTRGLLMPGAFIDLIEDTGLCLPVGWFILERAIADLALWQRREEGLEAGVCVNVSGRFFLQDGLTERLAELLDRYRITQGSLRLEVTENILLDHDNFARERLAALRRLGVKLYVDDFGTGYSSLTYLQRFQYDALKIDRSFVADLGIKSDAGAIVTTLVRLGQSLGMQVIAEGVESEEQVQKLRGLGCPMAQGFWFARPLTSMDAIAFMTGFSALPTATVDDPGARQDVRQTVRSSDAS